MLFVGSLVYFPLFWAIYFRFYRILFLARNLLSLIRSGDHAGCSTFSFLSAYLTENMGHHGILALNSQPLLALIQPLSRREDTDTFFCFPRGDFT
jgi:hypothetical protein